MTATRPIRVYVLDDHPVVAMGIKIALAADPRLCLVGQASTPEAGVGEAILAGADALVLDLAFAGVIRLDAVQLARRSLPNAVIVIFSALTAHSHAGAAKRSGADAFVTKDHDIVHLVAVIAKAHAERAGETRRSVAPVVPSPPEETFFIDGIHLTKREAQVAARLGRGCDIGDIAAELALSRRTISIYRDSVRRKLGFNSSRELVAKLVRLDAAAP